MITLYSYPGLFGVADNNAFGLKVFAFLKLTGVAFEQRQIFDASQAPRGQLPYIVDGEHTIGDSDPIIAHLVHSRGLAIDAGLPRALRWIPKGMQVEYLKKATGRMTAVARVDGLLDGDAAREVPVRVDITDPRGEVVFRAVIAMWVSPRPSS